MKLHRPYIPVDVRAKVARRQLEAIGVIPQMGNTLQRMLFLLFGNEQCQLDHDPALTNRKFNARTKKYRPDANDPRFLIYRAKVAHDIKTRVRGDGAQLSDLALRRKMKRIAKRITSGKRHKYGGSR